MGLIGGATTQYHDSSVESGCLLGGPGNPSLGIAPCDFLVSRGPADLRPAGFGTDAAVTPFVGANLQLMTPAFEPVPLGARFFVSGEVILTFGSTRNIVIEGDPSRVRLPATIDFPRDTNTLLLNGVGSRTTSEIQTLGYGAGIGVAFPFEFRGRRLWLKPSLVWTRFEIDVEGLVVAGLKDDPVIGLGNSPPWGSQIREIILSGVGGLVQDGIGPGLELELEAGRFGPVGASVFGNFNTYRILGNRTVKLTDAKLFGPLPRGPAPGNPNGLPADLYTASWSLTTNAWLFRGAVGIRFQWLGR